ncbi:MULTISPECIES: cytochrome P450 [Flavobacterium]|uniref:Cytochrome P450 n=1 Tax=Flavobacterium jumunjinense TaxID=998845 RepID=A0ABV5GTJ2_9FLAO|nr:MULTISPECIES: cytochrome P450 [Flavobacterium]
MKLQETESVQEKIRTLEDLPSPKAIPLFGNAHKTPPKDFNNVLEDWSRKFGEPYFWKFFSRPVVVFNEAESVKEIMRNRPGAFRRFSKVREIFNEMGIHGIVTAEGAEWRLLRTALAPAFNNRSLELFFPEFSDITERLMHYWKDKCQKEKTFDITADLKRYSVDITSIHLFNEDLNTIEKKDDTFHASIDIVFSAIYRRLNTPVPYWKLIKFPQDHKLDMAMKKIEGEINDLIAKARKKLENITDFSQVKGLMETMIIARDEEGSKRKLSDKEITNNLLLLMLGGEDTSANALTWMFYYLSRHQEIQEKVHQEAVSVLKNENLPRDKNHILNAFPYLRAVIQETLVLKSPTPFVILEANEDTIVSDIMIPEKTIVVVMNRISDMKRYEIEHHNDFDPERWLDVVNGEYTLKPNSNLNLAFGYGPRLCIGKSLALIEMVLIASMMVKNFKILPPKDEDYEIKEYFDFLLRPKGLEIEIVPRE